MAARTESERRRKGRGCAPGCGGAILVLTLGLVLSLFHVAIGIGVSVRIPFTQANITAAASIGLREKAASALPPYVRNRLGSNRDAINNTSMLTIGPAEGAGIVVIGDQRGAPLIDLALLGR